MLSLYALKVIDASPCCRYGAEDGGLPSLEDIFSLEGQDQCVSRDLFLR